MVRALDKIQTALASLPPGSVDPELEALRLYSIPEDTNALVPYGALQAWHKGRLDRQAYGHLVRNNEGRQRSEVRGDAESDTRPDRGGAFVRASGDFDDKQHDRVLWTAVYWHRGFMGKDFPSQTLVSPSDVRTWGQADGVPLPLELSEKKGSNNTLGVGTCPAYLDAEPRAAPRYLANTVGPVIADRLVHRLLPSAVDISSEDVLSLMDLCTYWTLGGASVTKSQATLELNPLCRVFNHDEWRVYEYARDLASWETQGYGTPYHRAAAQGFLRELVARFNGTSPPLDYPTSLNTSLDGIEGMFPLPPREKGEEGYRVFFDAAHSGSKFLPIMVMVFLKPTPTLFRLRRPDYAREHPNVHYTNLLCLLRWLCTLRAELLRLAMVPILTALGLYQGPAPSSKPNAERSSKSTFHNARFMPFLSQVHFQRLTCRLPPAASPPTGPGEWTLKWKSLQEIIGPSRWITFSWTQIGLPFWPSLWFGRRFSDLPRSRLGLKDQDKAQDTSNLSSEFIRIRVNSETQPARGQSWCFPSEQDKGVGESSSAILSSAPWTSGLASSPQSSNIKEWHRSLLERGLCPLPTVLQALNWVNRPDDWERCYD